MRLHLSLEAPSFENSVNILIQASDEPPPEFSVWTKSKKKKERL